MRILLINPPITRGKNMSRDKMRLGIFFPLGLAYLISYLREKHPHWVIKGHDALFGGKPIQETYGEFTIRYGETEQQLRRVIKDFKPHVVGTSCLFPSAEKDALDVLRITKNISDNIITLMGGVHPTNNASVLLEKNKYIDYIILGEGEVSTSELLSFLELKKKEHIKEMRGVAFRDEDNIVVHRKSGEDFIQNLDLLPFPDRKHFQLEKYLEYGEPHASTKQKPYTQVLSSRGCPQRCSYCSLRQHWGFKPRFRSPQNVVDEIAMLVNEYGVREIHFEDDNFTANKQRALEIFRLLEERDIHISISCPSGTAVAHLDGELIQAMAKAGFYSISLGIESGDPHVLKDLMKKNVDLDKAARLISTMRKVGIDARAFFILGYPGETKESILRTVKYAKSLQLDWTYFFIFTPYPNTPIYKTCIEKGYIKDGIYDTETYNFRRSILQNTDWEPGWLENLREEAIIECNFRNNPNRILRNYSKALQDIGTVAAAYPNFDFANFYLAETYHEVGDMENAIAYWQKTLHANPAHEEARARLKEYYQYA